MQVRKYVSKNSNNNKGVVNVTDTGIRSYTKQFNITGIKQVGSFRYRKRNLLIFRLTFQVAARIVSSLKVANLLRKYN
jgi:hypothetical protein